jgi:hypothetical protein
MSLPRYTSQQLNGRRVRGIVLEGQVFPPAADTVNALQQQQDGWSIPQDIAIIGCGLFMGRIANVIGRLEWNIKLGVSPQFSKLTGFSAGTAPKNGALSALTHAQNFSAYGQDFTWLAKDSRGNILGQQPIDNIALIGGQSGIDNSPSGLIFGRYYDNDTSGGVQTAGQQDADQQIYKEHWLPSGYAAFAHKNETLLLTALGAWSTTAAVSWAGNDLQAIAHVYYVPLADWLSQWVK